MKYLLNIFAVVFLAWIFVGAPIPYIGVKKLQPSAELPTFGSDKAISNGDRSPTYDPKIRSISVNYLNEGVKEINENQCDFALEKLKTGAIGFLMYMKKKYPDFQSFSDVEEKDVHSFSLILEAHKDGYLAEDDFKNDYIFYLDAEHDLDGYDYIFDSSDCN